MGEEMSRAGNCWWQQRMCCHKDVPHYGAKKEYLDDVNVIWQDCNFLNKIEPVCGRDSEALNRKNRLV
jgi:hypothetical protein